MKLKKGFEKYEILDDKVLINVENNEFSGLIKFNKSAEIIIDGLSKGLSRDKIINKMLQTYDAPKDQITQDVNEVINKLNECGILED